MRKWIILVLTALSVSSFAQQVYKPFEVDTEAQPAGGQPMLEKFIEANRRMPYGAEVSKVKGAVIVSGVVEPDGKVSDVQVVRPLRPDCDREAVRLFSLFNAWKPALKGGQRVRQQMTYMIRFVPTCAHCEEGQTVAYYTNEGAYTLDETGAEYRIVTPVDTMGYPSGHASAFKRQKTKWTQIRQFTFEKEPYVYRNTDEPDASDSASAYRLTLRGSFLQYEGTIYSFYANHSPLSKEQYAGGKRVGENVYYYPTALVKRLEEQLEGGSSREWFWYPNGQLGQIGIRGQTGLRIIGQWNSAGGQSVKEGQGMAHLYSRQGNKWVFEQGRVEDGAKEGQWLGRYSDSTLFYRESYAKGKFVSGVTYNAEDSLVYDNLEIMPEFKGGMSALGRFLAQNIRYPVEASKAGAQGKVFVSFVVCDDGTLCDYQVLQKMGWGMDEEALRVIKMMNGKWTPGVQRGRKVRVKYNLPINFAIN